MPCCCSHESASSPGEHCTHTSTEASWLSHRGQSATRGCCCTTAVGLLLLLLLLLLYHCCWTTVAAAAAAVAAVVAGEVHPVEARCIVNSEEMWPNTVPPPQFHRSFETIPVCVRFDLLGGTGMVACTRTHARTHARRCTACRRQKEKNLVCRTAVVPWRPQRAKHESWKKKQQCDTAAESKTNTWYIYIYIY